MNRLILVLSGALFGWCLYQEFAPAPKKETAAPATKPNNGAQNVTKSADELKSIKENENIAAGLNADGSQKTS